MKIIEYLVVGGIIYAIFRTGSSLERCRTARERAVAIRLSAACWFLVLLYLGAMLVLPSKGRLLLVLPGFFFAVSLSRGWRNSRERLRREAAGKPDLEGMKRVKETGRPGPT